MLVDPIPWKSLGRGRRHGNQVDGLSSAPGRSPSLRLKRRQYSALRPRAGHSSTQGRPRGFGAFGAAGKSPAPPGAHPALHAAARAPRRLACAGACAQAEGAAALAAGLEGNASLEALALAWNALGDAGAAALAGMLLQVPGALTLAQTLTLSQTLSHHSREVIAHARPACCPAMTATPMAAWASGLAAARPAPWHALRAGTLLAARRVKLRLCMRPKREGAQLGLMPLCAPVLCKRARESTQRAVKPASGRL